MRTTRWQHEKGVTLIEVLLVLAIAASLIILSFRQYQALRADQELRIVQYNVDNIFQGLAGFYKANCYGQSTSGSGGITPGDLYVSQTKHPANPFPVNIATQLVNAGYIPNGNFLKTTIVDSSTGTDGYLAQFNQFTPNKIRNVCVENTGSTPAFGSATSQNCKTSVQIGTIITWKAQVAVHLNAKAAANAKSYLALLNGDCLSSAAGGGVQPCSSSGNTGDYVVWERLPSFARQSSVVDSYEMNPLVDQFTQMYTTYPSGYLISSVGKTPSGDQQYFYCGD